MCLMLMGTFKGCHPTYHNKDSQGSHPLHPTAVRKVPSTSFIGSLSNSFCPHWQEFSFVTMFILIKKDNLKKVSVSPGEVTCFLNRKFMINFSFLEESDVQVEFP